MSGMTWWRRIVGTDLMESVIWVVAGVLIANVTWQASHDDIASQGAVLGILLAFGVRRHFLVRALRSGEETSGAWRAADLEGRVAELEALHQRVAELEERVDFNERLLAQAKDPARLEAPR